MIYAIAAALVTAALLYTLLFADWEEFADCVKFYFTPDIISLVRGKFWGDNWAETKLALWLGISGLVGVLVYANFS